MKYSHLSEGYSTVFFEVVAKGYGEEYILNRCTTYKAKCSEEEHAINRRVEIKIL